MSVKQFSVLLAGLLLILVGCRQQVESTGDVSIDLKAEDMVTGDTVFTITVTDPSGDPVDNAKVNVRGDMNHAGMNPVIRDVETSTDGVYTVPFNWSMAGKWFVDVTVTTSSGETTVGRFDFTIESDGGMDMPMGEATPEVTEAAGE